MARLRALWVKVEVRWGDFALAQRYLCPGERFTVGPRASLPLEVEPWDLVRAERGGARIVLRDTARVLAGGGRARPSAPYRAGPWGRELVLGREEWVELSVPYCTLTVTVEDAPRRPGRSPLVAAALMGAFAAASASVGILLAASACTVPPMMPTCDAACELAQEARVLRPLLPDLGGGWRTFDPTFGAVDEQDTRGTELCPPDGQILNPAWCSDECNGRDIPNHLDVWGEVDRCACEVWQPCAELSAAGPSGGAARRFAADHP